MIQRSLHNTPTTQTTIPTLQVLDERWSDLITSILPVIPLFFFLLVLCSSGFRLWGWGYITAHCSAMLLTALQLCFDRDVFKTVFFMDRIFSLSLSEDEGEKNLVLKNTQVHAD